ncbi:hypothetical protein BJI47_17725 [Rhodococcus sp. 1168]|nr:hypothetical protein [Rhodococcus sp. 1168]ORI21257.1 hypothetical protein BJI47_17725 [Rhodococcus sp. 1168]
MVQLFDQAVSARESKAGHKMREALAERAKAGEGRQALLDTILAIVTDPAVLDEQVGMLIRGEQIGWARLRSAQSNALPPLPRDHGHLASLNGSYGYLRQFTPQVLEAVAFACGTAAAELLDAVAILRELNATGARRSRRMPRPSSSRPAGAATSTPRPNRVTPARTDTIGSCACCSR